MAIYPTWQRYLKLWKTVVFPTLKRCLKITSYSNVYDEIYTLNLTDKLSQPELDLLIAELKRALEEKGYNVSSEGMEDCDLVLEGKNGDWWAPCITISVCNYEWEDDEILEWEDTLRWASDRIDEVNFKPSYVKFLEERNLVDNIKYDKLRSAPRKLQKAYCDWVRSEDREGHLWVEIMPCNM